MFNPELMKMALESLGLPTKAAFVPAPNAAPAVAQAASAVPPPMVPALGDPSVTGMPVDLSPPQDPLSMVPGAPQSAQPGAASSPITMSVDDLTKIIEAARGGKKTERTTPKPVESDAASGMAGKGGIQSIDASAASSPAAKAAGMSMGSPCAETSYLRDPRIDTILRTLHRS